MRWFVVLALFMFISRDRPKPRPVQPLHSMHFMKSQFTKAEARAIRHLRPRIPSR